MNISFNRNSIQKLLPRWAIYLPVFLLLAFSALNFYRVQTEATTNWTSGGWGFHSTYDSVLFRFVRLYGVNPDGSLKRIKGIKYGRLRTPIISRPIRKSAQVFIKDQLKRVVLKRGSFKEYRVEVWQYTFSGGEPQLGAKLIAAHNVKGGRK